MSMGARQWPGLVLAASVIALLHAAPAVAQKATPQVSPQHALINRYCVTCHNEKAKTAGLMLDRLGPDLDGASVGPHAETWEKVVRKLRVGAMPPQGMPRPDRAAMDSLAASIETSLDRAAAAQPNPGQPVLHRLNRTEYANAIRDLLDLDVDASDLLPTDDSSFGFDNIGSVLGVSPALIERYLLASGKVSRLAVGDPKIDPIVDTYRVRADLTQNEHIEGLPLGTRGGVLIRHDFPLDGDYVIKVKLLKSTVDLLFGNNAQDQLLEIALNGERVQTLTINPRVAAPLPKIAPPPAPVAGGKPQKLKEGFDPAAATKLSMSQPKDNLEARVHVSAGPQTVTVAFAKRSYGPAQDLMEPIDRSTFDPSDPKGLPHVLSVSISGPFNAQGSGDTPSRRKIFVCHPADSSDELPCAKKIISTLARHAYRRPVSDADLETLLSFYQSGRNKGDFETGIEMALRRILSDPQFVYRFERDPANVAPDTPYRISDLELASRLSFFLWSSIPDDELLDVAADGKLHDPAVLEHQVRRMLADARADSLVSNFADQWLYLRNLRGVAPDLEAFPNFDDNLREAFKRETELFFGSIIHEDRSVIDLLNADYTFVNERLARHYGVPNVYGSQFRRISWPEDSPRRGLLGQGSILTVTSIATRTSPVQRGKWLLENVLGTPPNPPPANVPALKENKTGDKQLSVRERMEAHRKNPPCAGCHKVLDPLGFALENFDAVGQWRTVSESGEKIDASGVLADGTKVNGVDDLRKALLSRPNVFAGTMTEKLMTYALGRGLEYYDMPAVRAVVHRAARNDYRFSSLILGIVGSTPFQMRRSQDRDAAAPATSVADIRRPNQP
jgi:mono/diheme cytochrome c family protein